MKILLAILALGLFCMDARAGALDGITAPGEIIPTEIGLLNIRPALGNFFARSLPTTPLKKGLLEGKVAVGIFEMTRESGDGDWKRKQSLPGSGAAAAMVYGLSEHWGITALAGSASSKGKFTEPTPYYAPSPAPLMTVKPEEKAVNAALAVVWDHYSGDNFRLPILFGLSYMKYSEEVSLPVRANFGSLAGHDILISEKYAYDEFGYSIGIAPQFNTGQFRWVPFFFGTAAVNKGRRSYTEKDLTTGQTYNYRKKTDESGCVVGGVQFIYRPLNLGYTYIIPILSDIKGQDAMTSHTLTFSRKF